MPGNSQRRGAKRNTGSKKGQTVGTGGQKRRALQGKGPTPPAKDRTSHPAARRAKAAAKRAAPGSSQGRGRPARGASRARSRATRTRHTTAVSNLLRLTNRIAR